MSDIQSTLSTEVFITELFGRVDDRMREVPKHPQANLWPGEVVTLAILFALKGVGERAFYRWLVRDWLPLFPRLPERTRLFRLFAAHRSWAERFLAEPTFFARGRHVRDRVGAPRAGGPQPPPNRQKG